MKILFKATIISFISLFTVGTFAYTFEEVSVNQLKSNGNPVINTLTPSNELPDSITLNGSVLDMGNTLSIEANFLYMEIDPTIDINIQQIAFQTAMLLYMINPEITPNNLIKIESTTLNNPGDFSEVFPDFSEMSAYLYSACGEFINTQGDLQAACGDSLPFGNIFINPHVITGSVSDIGTTSANIFGWVSNFNSSENVDAFFVFGTDDEVIEDIPDIYDSYNEIIENGQSLRKVFYGELFYVVDSEFDSIITELDDNTHYYYSACIEFLDENNAPNLVCGNDESFVTENASCIGEDICIDHEYSDVDIIASDMVEYEINIQVEALAEDIYFPNDVLAFEIVRDDGFILDENHADLSIDLEFTGDFYNGSFHIEQGEHENFILTVIVSNIDSGYEGEYAVQLTHARYWRDGVYRENFYNLDTEEFRTEFEEIESLSPFPIITKNIR